MENGKSCTLDIFEQQGKYLPGNLLNGIQLLQLVSMLRLNLTNHFFYHGENSVELRE